MHKTSMSKLSRFPIMIDYLTSKKPTQLIRCFIQCILVILLTSTIIFFYGKYPLDRVCTNMDTSTSQSKESVQIGSPLPPTCIWKFDHYEPSAWETYWFDNISELQNHVCPTLEKSDQQQNSIRLLKRTIALQRRIFKWTTTTQVHDLFSKMIYKSQCSHKQTSRLVTQEIEPLIGLLRDPLTICPNLNSTVGDSAFPEESFASQSKRFLLLAPSAPYVNYASASSVPPWISQPNGQKILIDIGSSLFNELEGTQKIGAAISSRWFYEYFKNISLKFDRIIAFERGVRDPKVFWEQIPDELLSVYTFINVAVEPHGKYNPWKVLEQMAKPSDYVIVKLDIDVPDVEKGLLDELLKNELWLSLIDELFFEMHVSVKEMDRSWGRAGLVPLKDAYVLFSKLRQRGIRMHSWP